MSTILRPTLLLIVMLAIALVLPSVALPAEGFPPPDPGYSPPVSDQPEITLHDAVRVTLEFEPTIRIRSETVASQLGISQQATGQFDLALIGTISYELIQEEMTAADKLDQQNKRDDLRQDIDDANTDLERANQQISEIDEATGILEGGGDPSDINLTDPLMQAQLDVLLAAYRAAPPADQAEALANILNWLEDRRNLLLIDRNLAAVEAAAGRESLRRLGGIAEIERTQTGTVNLKLFKQFRTGITFAPFLDLTGSSLDWVGKPTSSDFGGPGSVDTYTSTVGFSLVIPFGRGHGRESTGAREQAANIDYEATRSALTHTAAASVLNTLIGYWDLVAAQETLAIQESSLELQTKLVEMVQALVQGDEMPRSEISRMKARLAEVEAQVEDARRRLYESRVALASVIGFDVQHGEQAPMAAEGFPVYPTREAIAELPVEQLADLAMSRRYDLLSAQQLESSGKVLWRAAVIDLAPIADLDMRVSYSGLHEGGTVANGIDGSLLGSWVGPSAKLGFNYEQPIGNNVQKGRLEQQTAQYRTRAINSRNLARLIRANLVKAVGSLEEAVAQLDSYRLAAGYYQEAVDNEFEKLRYGRSTLIDAITTQRRQVGATLALVASQKTVAQLLSQLKFESGTMVVEGPDGEPQIAPNLTSLPETTGSAGGSS